MCKRLWKNVILALCVLALVFQPVTIFGLSGTGIFSDPYVLDSDSVTIGSYSLTITDDFSNFSTTANNYNLNSNNVIGMYKTSSTTTTLTELDSNYPYPVFDNYNSAQIYLRTESGSNNNASKTNYNKGQYGSFSTDSGAHSITFNSNFQFYIPSDISIFYISSTDANATGWYLNPNYTGDPGGGSGDLSNIETYLANLYLQIGLLISNNFRSYTPDGTPVNNSWVGVGEYLTYMMLCQQQSVGVNKSLSVTYTDQGGNTVTKTNWLAWMGDWILEATNHLYYIRNNITSASSDISDINNRLELAFPDDQADMNDHIADTLLDDTNGNGLTISKISSAKSNLDDGLDTFKLDTSQSQYSNPFSALGDADWSFWSQTTLNNLGSGYSYSFGEGSLMSENEDIFTENQNDLLNLLGW